MSANFPFTWATIVLAAGSSSRMGQSKQLISIAGETLLDKTINAAIQVGSAKIVVVTGANQEPIEDSLKSKGVDFIHNPDWKNGMGSSLKCGLSFVTNRYSEIDATLILVCDQPLLTTSHIKKMLEEFSQRTPIVASFYSGGNGVPVLFHKSLFQLLFKIDDQQGAKKIIEQNPTLVKSIDFPNGGVDLDTPEDLQKFQNWKERI